MTSINFVLKPTLSTQPSEDRRNVLFSATLHNTLSRKSMRINHKHFVYIISLPELAWKKGIKQACDPSLLIIFALSDDCANLDPLKGRNSATYF